MKRVLWGLQARLLRGRVVRRLRLLRQPRYLAGTVIGLAWMGWWISRMFLRNGNQVEVAGSGALDFLSADTRVAVLGAAGLVVALLLTLIWSIPWSRTSLRLSEAEAHMLLPAPLSRRDVLHHALLKSQPGILFSSVILTIFLGAGPFPGRLAQYPIFWLLLTLWDTHMKGRSLWWGRIRELPAAQARRRVLLLAALLATFWLFAGAGVIDVFRTAGVFEVGITDLGATLRAIATAGHSALDGRWLGLLLFPFTAVLAPVFATTPVERGASLVFPAALLFVQHEWVTRFRTRFEEAAMARAHQERRRHAPDSRFRRMSSRARRAAPFRLLTTGRPEMAIVWKNLMAVQRTSFARQGVWLGVLLAGLLIAPLPFGRPLPYWVLQVAGVGLLAYFVLVSSFHHRHDFRMDLPLAEVLRPWPVAGAHLAAAELLAPIVTVSMRCCAAVGLVVVGDLGVRLTRSQLPGEIGLLQDQWSAGLGLPAPLLAAVLGASVLPVVVAIAALSIAVQNTATLLFPSWAQLGRHQQKGAAQFGQRILVFWGLGLCITVGLLPAAMLVGGVLLAHWGLGWPVGGWELPLLGLLATLPLAVETAGLAVLCGRLWARLDPSAELLGATTA